jgi:hypothetical protein
MLAGASLDPKFWPYAFTTSCNFTM